MLKRPVRRKRQKLSDVIVESVKRSIVTDALRPGDRLPTEKELMESFQSVSYTHLTLPTKA
mgnify:CR=1 FL=1